MKLLSSNRIWWTPKEVQDELRMSKDLFFKLQANGCFGPHFQPGGKGGKMLLHRDNIEAFVKADMEQNQSEIELPKI